MADPKEQYERWLGSGVVWQCCLVVVGVMGIYYARMQALNNAEATGSDALAKIQNEAKANFTKLEDTLQQMNARMVKLEKSEQVARQEIAIAALQTKLASLENKYKEPEQAKQVRSALDDVTALREARWADIMNRQTVPNGAPGSASLLPPDWRLSTSSLLKTPNLLENQDKRSLQQILDDVKPTPPSSGFSMLDTPKFQWTPVPKAPEPQTFVEKAVDAAKAYWLLILILVVAAFSKK